MSLRVEEAHVRATRARSGRESVDDAAEGNTQAVRLSESEACL